MNNLNISWQSSFWNNTLESYVIAIVVFILIAVVFKAIKNRLWHRLDKLSQRSKTKLDDKLVEVVKSIKPNFYLVFAVWFSSQFLTLNFILEQIINTALIIMIFYQLTVAGKIVVEYWVSRENNEQKKNLLPILVTILNIVIWSFGLLLVLSNLGVDVTSLIAGLGVGGIAVALAAQSILGDLFASLTIYFDKPFEVGDFIVLDADTMGTVEQIGFRTSRIRALKGEEIVMSNSDLTSRKIHNYKKMNSRRVVINLGVIYGTASDKLKKIPDIIKKIIDDIDGLDFDRAHFKEFGSSALLFESVYFVGTADYNQYMDLNQQLHLQIKEKFEAEGIEIAFPSQTIYLEKE